MEYYGAKTLNIFARDLKVGDKVNCYEGWQIVKEIEDKNMIYVTYDNGTETHYSKDYRLFVVRWNQDSIEEMESD